MYPVLPAALALLTPVQESAPVDGTAGLEDAEPPPVARDGGSLFPPVPRDQMREFSADRPDVTESPITVDAGHFQFEVGLADWSRERQDDSLALLQVNAKVGLTPSTDLQVVLNALSIEDDGGGSRNEGLGPTLVRLKWNQWGNDGGTTALAVMPFVLIPSGGDVGGEEWGGGLIVPFATSLSDRVGLGLQAEFDVLYDQGAEEHRGFFLHTASLGYELTERWGAFVEGAGIASEENYVGLLNVGTTVEVARDFVLDGGFRFGVTDAAPDLAVFLGFTARY
ncbi:MAG: transporter [Planctomycetota bacterium]